MLNAAIAALDTLTSSDITEVKGMSNPPAPVKMVMEAVCIMKGVKPARVKNKDGKMGDDYWESAKKMLMDSKFLDLLKAYDKDNIKPKIIKKIDPTSRRRSSNSRWSRRPRRRRSVFLGPRHGGVRSRGQGCGACASPSPPPRRISRR